MFQTEIRVPFLQSHLRYQFQALTGNQYAISTTMMAKQRDTPELNTDIYECASCHMLTEDLVVNHNCAAYVNGR